MTKVQWLMVVLSIIFVGVISSLVTRHIMQKEMGKKVSQNVAEIKTIQPAVTDTSRHPVDPMVVKIGDMYGSWTVSSVEPIEYNSEGAPVSGGVDFTGTVVFRGFLSDSPYSGLGFIPAENDQNKFPVSVRNAQDRMFELMDLSHELYDTSGELTSFGKSLLQKEIGIEVTQFHLPFGAGNSSTAQFIRIVD